MAETFFITTAIDYTNAPPHLGHAYEKILADIIARYHRLKGDATYFLTGVDQHGQKVQQAAQKAGVAPEEFVANTTKNFADLWERLELSYDGWAATTDPRHKECVREILQALYEQGQIYQAKYKGFYSVRQEQFLTDKERGPDGQFGAEWGEVVELEEESWYFRLEKHRDWLLDFLARTPDLVFPGFRQIELRNAVEKLSGDLSISRPKSRLSWGIELPFDSHGVTYVWFDALVNYISFAGYRQARDASGNLIPGFPHPPAAGCRWPALHVIGKDILIPAHGIYWLAMLRALGFAEEQMPRFLVHGHLLVDGEKMSKSLGNFKDPHTVADRFGVEALRYYLMRDCVCGQDVDYTDQRLVQRYNTDLANTLGNLLNRALSMARKYRGGRLARTAQPCGLAPAEQVRAYTAAMDEFRVHAALESASAIAVACNQFIDAEKPWLLAKDPGQAARLDAVLYYLAESLRIIGVLIAPVLPRIAAGIYAQLQWTGSLALQEADWGRLPDGHVIGAPTPLCPRIEA